MNKEKIILEELRDFLKISTKHGTNLANKLRHEYIPQHIFYHLNALNGVSEHLKELENKYKEKDFRMDVFNQDIAFYAFRYALGRMTYAVSTVAEYLILNKSDFDEHHKNLIVKEIKEAIEKGRAGMKMDEEMWNRVVEEFEV